MTSLDKKEKIVTNISTKKKILLAALLIALIVSVVAIILLVTAGDAPSGSDSTDNHSGNHTATINPADKTDSQDNAETDAILKESEKPQSTDAGTSSVPSKHPAESTANPSSTTVINSVETYKPYDPTPAVTNSPDTKSTISLSNVSAKRGDTITLKVDISANPGIVTMSMKISCDPQLLELKSVTDSGLLKGTMLNPDYSLPYMITWVDGETKTNNTKNGTIATFTFKIKDNAPSGITYVSLYFIEAYDTDCNPVHFNYVSGIVTIQ